MPSEQKKNGLPMGENTYFNLGLFDISIPNPKKQGKNDELEKIIELLKPEFKKACEHMGNNFNYTYKPGGEFNHDILVVTCRHCKKEISVIIYSMNPFKYGLL